MGQDLTCEMRQSDLLAYMYPYVLLRVVPRVGKMEKGGLNQ